MFTESVEEARALNDAGIDMIVTYVGCAREIRRAAPDMFMTVGMGVNDPEICSDADAIRAGLDDEQRGCQL